VAGGTGARIGGAREAGTALNVWNAEPARVAERAAAPDGLEVTWAGPSPADPSALVETVHAVGVAGASWAVFGWPVDCEALVAAARGAAGG
jgi:hypothetical protein